MNDLDKIKDLLGSPDETNRELGIVLAISQGMSIEELADKCYNKGWFIEKDIYHLKSYNDFKLNEYDIVGLGSEANLYYKNEIIHKIDSYDGTNGFIKMITLFLQDNYPELIKNKL